MNYKGLLEKYTLSTVPDAQSVEKVVLDLISIQVTQKIEAVYIGLAILHLVGVASLVSITPEADRALGLWIRESWNYANHETREVLLRLCNYSVMSPVREIMDLAYSGYYGKDFKEIVSRKMPNSSYEAYQQLRSDLGVSIVEINKLLPEIATQDVIVALRSILGVLNYKSYNETPLIPQYPPLEYRSLLGQGLVAQLKESGLISHIPMLANAIEYFISSPETYLRL